MDNLQFFSHLVFGLSLAIISAFVTWMMLYVVKIIDHPNERSSHTIAVPKSGGIAIVITFSIGMLGIYLFTADNVSQHSYFFSFVFCSLFIAAISLYDDIKNKSVKFKFYSQIFAVVLALWSGIVINEIALPGIGYTQLGWFGYLISFIWILGLTNAYNFMDGLDGLMGGITIIATLFFMVICFYQGSSFIYITCYTILAGALGFILFNISPAKIFMGDVGSAFLGFTLAVMAIIAARYDNSHTSFLVMPLLLFNVIYDTTFTYIRRFLNNEKVTQAHRSHLYQLMNQIGYSHLEVSLTHYNMAFLQGLGALWMVQIPGSQRLYIFIPFILLQVFYSYWIIKRAKQKKIL